MNLRVPYTEIELGGILLQEPVGLATNLLIVAVCLWAVARLRRTGAGLPLLFFSCMASAHLVGGIAHTFFYVFGEPMHIVGWLFSAVGLGVLEIVSLRRAWPGIVWWSRAVVLQLCLFTVAAIAFRNFIVTAIHAAVGLLFIVLPALVVALRRDGSRTARWQLGAIGVMVAPGLVNALALSPHRWFNANDLGHVLIAVAFWMFYRGFAAERSD